MKKKLILLSLAMIIFSALNISCMHNHYKSKCKCKKYKKIGLALVTPVNDSKISGWIHFHKQERKKVTVKAEIKGLKPKQKYGFHVHKYGDCRENGKNAGAHLGSYRKNKKHGSADSEERHMGDLGNLVAGEDGTAIYKKTVNMCMRKLGGRSVIIHAQEDDLKSQPSGNAGSYIGCGIIGYVQSLNDNTNDKTATSEKKKEKSEKEKEK